MPKLPPFSNDVTWKDYEISTPTFQLSPVEKPDMSPFLIHMTGREEIYAILNGENAPEGHPEEHGFLQASIPEGNRDYNAAVVCFTDAPTFVVDFFRYRKFNRWQNDQRFGIGFSKELMVERGVRPVLYLGSELLQMVMNAKEAHAIAGGYSERLKTLGSSLYPLMFPLGDDMPGQGFMWEREWRHPSPDGLAFPLSGVKLICCPEDEEEGIRGVLGASAEGIHFIRAWDEYDEVTMYLAERESQWEGQVETLPEIDDLEQLQDLKRMHQQVIHSLEKHEQVIEGLQTQLELLNNEKARLGAVIEQIDDKLDDFDD